MSLKDVHFGDVWICSGQSNMEFSMGGVEDWDAGGVFNSEEEITKTAEYPNIRMFKLALMTASNPQDDLKETEFETWARSDDSTSVSQFSAVCLLTARYMADVLGKDKVRTILIEKKYTVSVVLLRHLIRYKTSIYDFNEVNDYLKIRHIFFQRHLDLLNQVGVELK